MKRNKKVHFSLPVSKGSEEDENEKDDSEEEDDDQFIGFDDDLMRLDDLEETKETRQLVIQQNRKKKKSGGFQSMGLSFPVFKGVMKKGYRVPTPIQRKTIPLILDGKDVVAMARTGSGKTAAFLVPMFEKLKTHSAKIGIRGLVLSPTRELALQTMKFTKELGRFTGLRSAVVLGGDRMEYQFATVHENPDIVIATPGRFLHILIEMDLKLSSIEYVVFDEADRLFEMGFSEQLKEIIRRMPEMRQTLLFSATLPKLLVEFARAGLNDPVLIRLDVDNKLSDQLRLSYLSCRADDKPAVLLHFIRSVIPKDEQSVVFVATKHDVEYFRELLLAAGIDSSFVYSSLDQTARKISIGKFIHRRTNVMLVTDVAARGIDIPLLDNVINYNFPSKPKLFVHRVGRVARAGRSGTAYSFVSSDEVPYMIDLHLFLGRSLATSGKDGVFGAVPQSLIDDEEDFLRHAHSINSDLISLKQVSSNGMKQYIKSRNPPAPESIKRAKEFPSPLPIHPIFEKECSSSELERSRLLDSLKCYKPSQTIFEVNPTSKGLAREVMKLKRDAHSKIVSAVREKRLKREECSSDLCEGGRSDLGDVNRKRCGQFSSEMEMSTEDDLKIFQTATMKRKGKLKEEQPYIHYTPADHHTEKGLSLDNTVNFEQQASTAILDITGDQGETIKRTKGLMKWDRKRKRFVREGGKEGTKKRVKTESGAWVSSSYKSGIYKNWKDSNRLDGMLAGEENEDTITNEDGWRRKKGRLPSVPKRKVGKGGKVEGGLRSVDEILKKREKMQFMKKRRQMKDKRGSGSKRGRGKPATGRGRGGGRGGGRGTGGKSRGGSFKGSKGRKR